jgi:hypothetical protein
MFVGVIAATPGVVHFFEPTGYCVGVIGVGRCPNILANVHSVATVAEITPIGMSLGTGGQFLRPVKHSHVCRRNHSSITIVLTGNPHLMEISRRFRRDEHFIPCVPIVVKIRRSFVAMQFRVIVNELFVSVECVRWSAVRHFRLSNEKLYVGGSDRIKKNRKRCRNK